ncbi:MAG TPA: mechanosensitive ion channel, partial [Sphingomicrobium sp.]|nr:mechanosensitive ion channel [Sphingomicrobium sp.]
PEAGGESIGTEIGRLAYWLVWLVGLIAALQPLGLSGVLTPVTNLTNEVFAFLPRLLGAGLFFFAGLILARVVRHVVEAFLGALNLERLLGRAGVSIGEAPLAVDEGGVAQEGVAPARSSIARAVGVTVSAVIIIFAAIAALQILQVSAISDPATAMLQSIALAIPRVLAALVWLAIAFLIGRWVKAMLETVLPSLGFDRSVHALGIMPAGTNPSKVVGAIAMTAILLAAAIEAARQLGGDSVAALLFQITELGGKVIFGTVIIVVGLFLARILAGLVGSSTGEASYAETIVKYAIIALFTAIGLTFMGLANEIVMIAFGLILGSAAVATALAFGLGGRDWAARQLEDWSGGDDRRRAPQPPRIKRQPPPSEDDSQPPLV